MPVIVKLPTVLAGLADGHSIEVAGATVGEIIGELSRRYPLLRSRLSDADGTASPFINFFVNGSDIRIGSGVSTPLANGDEITVIVPVAGG